jgi:hypothetical protein
VERLNRLERLERLERVERLERLERLDRALNAGHRLRRSLALSTNAPQERRPP